MNSISVRNTMPENYMPEKQTKNHHKDTFTHKYIPALDKYVHRLGLSSGYGLNENGIRTALDIGINYLFFSTTSYKMKSPIKDFIKNGKRDDLVIATGATFGYFSGSIRRSAERALKSLGTDYLDIFQLYWLGKMSFWNNDIIDEMVKLKNDGLVRAIGVSIHDRVKAGNLAEASPLDMLMIRYNAVHPGAEQDIFPKAEIRKPIIVAYTATCWQKLLKAPSSGWKGEIPTAGTCYRFCLTNKHVDVVLSAPKHYGELQENINALELGPLSDEELLNIRAFGKFIHK